MRKWEIARNLPYGGVGLIGGWPAGRLEAEKTVVRDGRTFTVQTTVRNIDNPFDGLIGGSPNDTAPADYRLVELLLTCPDCPNSSPQRFDTWIAPVSLESSSTNGALFVRVFDASGLPVPGAAVLVENSSANPAFTIEDTTDNDGLLQLIDVPPGSGAYAVTVSRDGYSSERTYPIGDSGNPNPTKPNATVATAALTQVSFSIDRLGSLNVQSADSGCTAVPNVSFTLMGSKLIGTGPTVLKYRVDHATDGTGQAAIDSLEWDTYSLLAGSPYDLAGTIPPMPLVLGPGAARDVTMVVEAANPRRLLVTVLDDTTNQPLTDATVRLTRTGYDQTKTAGRGYRLQTDWSGGSGQDDFTETDRYFDQDGNLNDQTGGQLTLRRSGFRYVPSGYLTSSTFDMGTSPADFYQVTWMPQGQPSRTGSDPVRLQLATNNDNLTWNFVGPDGTADTYYTLTDQNVWNGHDGFRYLRYRLYLDTADTRYTPTVSDVSFSFTAGCLPPGQVSFAGLSYGNYTLTVSKTGYSAQTGTVAVSADWQNAVVELGP